MGETTQHDSAAVVQDEAFLCSKHDRRPSSIGRVLIDTTGKGCFLCNMFSGMKKKKTYACSLCYKKFETIKELRRHQEKHFRQKRFKCRQCDQRFRTQEERTAHRITHKKDKKLLKCKVC